MTTVISLACPIKALKLLKLVPMASMLTDQPAATFLKHTATGYATLPAKNGVANDGFKGFEVGANYTLAKNIVAGVKYFDLEAREGDADEQTLWSEVVFTF